MVHFQYAERQPIGLEKIIRTVPANRVRDFYHRWYKPEHMTVVVVGDFEDTKVRNSKPLLKVDWCSVNPRNFRFNLHGYVCKNIANKKSN
jgi:predicted Zn-dependent peptidase